MKTILFNWLGDRDINASKGKGLIGPIGVAAATDIFTFDEVVILSIRDEATEKAYKNWLRQALLKKRLNKPDIHIRHVRIREKDVKNYAAVYPAARDVIRDARRQYGRTAEFVYNISPGTSAMSASWIILSKVFEPGELIQLSTDEKRIEKVEFPFNIEAELIERLSVRDTIGREPLNPEDFGAKDFFEFKCQKMQEAYGLAVRVAQTKAAVLILGETGTGKEGIARLIHNKSGRKKFEAINCGALPSELIESILFGYVKGSFTGAVSDKKGLIQSTAGGTVFLDEIGDMPQPAQVKLLRVIQEGMVRQVGALSETRVDIRIIAATNRGLKKEVIDRKFREDLYYRISEFPISLPPLRERGSEDLVNFLRRLMKTISRDTMSLSDRAIRLLCAQDWPGNIREVNNILSRAFLLNGATVINEDTIRKILEEENFCMASGDILNRPIDESFNLPEIINEVSRHYISKAMNLTNNNKSETARRLGLKNHQNLTNLMKKAGYGKNDISPITYSGNMIFNKSQVAAHTSNPVSRASCKTNKRRDCFPPRFARGRNDERDKHRLCEECNRRSNLWF